MMMNVFRAHARKIAAGLLLFGALGASASTAYAQYAGSSCCSAGASCCHPGAPCCHGRAAAQQ